MSKIRVGDHVKTVIHGELAYGTCVRYEPNDPAGLVYDFHFDDGTKILMPVDQVNREVVFTGQELPKAMERRIRTRD